MNRRRFIKILAASATGLSLNKIASATTALKPVRWQGYTLGAEGSFTLYTEKPRAAQAVLQRCFAEIQRLEGMFSLYDHKSEISLLNRTGYLKNPSADWLRMIEAVDHAYTLTDGLFDPTVQPLWKVYDAHFKAHPDSTALPGTELGRAKQQIGWAEVEYDAQAIRFPRPEMQLTLNGIAQGYITDRVSEILKEAGYANVLVELGETRAIGPHPEQRPWNIGIKDADQPTRIQEIAELDNQALATSGSYGSSFSKDGKIHHLIHPKTGHPTTRWKSLSVIAPTGTEADALSTGLSFADAQVIGQLQEQRSDLKFLLQ
jgi:thiamine biosynthesis lipoprotein